MLVIATMNSLMQDQKEKLKRVEVNVVVLNNERNKNSDRVTLIGTQ